MTDYFRAPSKSKKKKKKKKKSKLGIVFVKHYAPNQIITSKDKTR